MNNFYGRNPIPVVPLDHYNKQLLHYLHDYMEINDEKEYLDSQLSSTRQLFPNASEKAQIILRYKLYPDNLSYKKEYNAIKDEIGGNTNDIFWKYNNIIMRIIGKIAECVVVDNCNNDSECNRKLINLAMLKENINYNYADIEYSKYMAFSTSYKYTFKMDKEGFFNAYPSAKYSPCDTSIDIAWCLQDNPEVPLMYYYELNKGTIVGNFAHLQVKASTNCDSLFIKDYLITPIIVFDLDNNAESLKKRYPFSSLISARDIKPEMQNELEKYYRILLGYAAGIVEIDIDKLEYITNKEWNYLSQMSIKEILSNRILGVKESNIYEILCKHRKKAIITIPIKL